MKKLPPPSSQKSAQTMSRRRQNISRIRQLEPTQRRSQTRQRLLEAGRDLFINQGIAITSVGDICSQAGFSRGAFYSNFSDMAHFIQTLANEHWSSIISTVTEVVDDASNTPPALDQGLNEVINEISSRLLAAIPLTREFGLLIDEFTAYATRNDDEAVTPLRTGVEGFKRRIGELLSNELAKVGRISLLPEAEMTEIIIALAEKSMDRGIIGTEQTCSSFIERTLTTLLVQMTGPLHGTDS